MITVTKSILGLSALASAGAWTVIEPTHPAKQHAPAPAIMASGKIVDRAPMAGGDLLSSQQIIVRIRSAHGLPTGIQVAEVDCKQFAWPNIPSECISSDDGAQRRQVRVISAGSNTQQSPQATPPARVLR
ncbi:MAG: hypothetical protein ABWZ80_11025 [Beijerinckiaceae bacterium]